MRKAVIVTAIAAAVVTPFIGVGAAFAHVPQLSDYTVVVYSDDGVYESCDTVIVRNADGTYTTLGRPCNENPPLVQPEVNAS